MHVEFLHFVAGGAEILARVELAGLVVKDLADGGGHRETAVGVNVDLADGALGSLAELLLGDADCVGQVAAVLVDDVDIFLRYGGRAVENNYVPDILKPTASLRTAKPDFWIAKKDFVERVRQQVIKMRVELYEKQEMPKIMESAGYFYVKTTDGRGMEWVDLQEKILRETPQPDPNQMNNGMGPGMGPGMMPPPMPPGGY